MTFFNKNQEVMDIQLTRFGRNSLARGVFKPVFYQFFDDDIIYSVTRLGHTEDQNDAEVRIKDSVRLRTQHTTVSLEKSFEEQKELIAAGHRGTFLKLRRQADPLEKDKLLKYPLANCKMGSQPAPYFKMETLSAKISGSLEYPNPAIAGIFKNRPEITIKPKYTYIVDRRNTIEPEDIVSLIDPESHIDLMGDKIEFLDGSTIERQKQHFIIDLEEMATSYGLDNFEVEIYEETEPGSEQYVQLQDEDRLYRLVNVKTDETCEEFDARSRTNRNFYSD